MNKIYDFTQVKIKISLRLMRKTNCMIFLKFQKVVNKFELYFKIIA
jgi:hypothetical protein